MANCKNRLPRSARGGGGGGAPAAVVAPPLLALLPRRWRGRAGRAPPAAEYGCRDSQVSPQEAMESAVDRHRQHADQSIGVSEASWSAEQQEPGLKVGLNGKVECIVRTDSTRARSPARPPPPAAGGAPAAAGPTPAAGAPPHTSAGRRRGSRVLAIRHEEFRAFGVRTACTPGVRCGSAGCC